MRLLLILAALSLVLTGCAGPKLTGEELVSINNSEANAQAECYKWLQDEAAAELLILESIAPADVSTYLMFKMMSDNQNTVIAALTGKSLNPCGTGENVYGYLARVAESQNKAAASIVGDSLSLVKWLGTAVVVSGAISDIADASSMEIYGDGNSIETTDISSGKDAINISGDNSSASSVDSEVNQEQFATGDTGDNNADEIEPEPVEAEETEVAELEIGELEVVD